LRGKSFPAAAEMSGARTFYADFCRKKHLSSLKKKGVSIRSNKLAP
jgi:hypothetical protein